jgi:hypothetical protein
MFYTVRIVYAFLFIGLGILIERGFNYWRQR